MSDAPTPKDVVIATMGASAALGGLVLVFVGLVIAAYQAYPADTPKRIKDKHRQAVWPVLGVFVACSASVAVGFWWLEAPGNSTLYTANNILFAAELIAMVGVAVATVRELLA